MKQRISFKYIVFSGFLLLLLLIISFAYFVFLFSNCFSPLKKKKKEEKCLEKGLRGFDPSRLSYEEKKSGKEKESKSVRHEAMSKMSVSSY